MTDKKILFVMSEASQIVGQDGVVRKTGYWLEEFAVPYQMFLEHGWQIDIATPLGKKPVADPDSIAVDNDGKCLSWSNNAEFSSALATKARAIDSGQILALRGLSDHSLLSYAGVFFPGGYAPIVDLTDCRLTANLLMLFHTWQKPTALFCHAPTALLSTKLLSTFIYQGYQVTSFSSTEELNTEVGRQLETSVEQGLVAAGTIFSKGSDWEPFVVTDRELITGQNTASTKLVAETFLNALKEKSYAHA